MKDLRKLIAKKTLTKAPRMLDEKSLFFILAKVVKEEYGKQGLKNITPLSYRDRKLLIRAGNDNWESEIKLNKAYLLKRLNEELGFDEVLDMKNIV